LRLVHLSDIHFWRYAYHPLRLLSKRLVGTVSLALGRARRFRLERVPELVDRVLSLEPDHILITGDLTTTALPDEFLAATVALGDLLGNPDSVTIIPGNHDRYTLRAHRSRRFEKYFGAFSPNVPYPWLRRIDATTLILGLDPTRAGISPRGRLPRAQLIAARELVEQVGSESRLIVACHYPVAVPAEFEREAARKPLANAAELAQWLRTVGPHLFCCGHVHAAWAFQPAAIPDQLCLNSGAPLMVDRLGHRLPGFLQIELEGAGVEVIHHSWTGSSWTAQPLFSAAQFLAPSATK
jgi:3',5'-cyclic AMP phosphodiesterase CpdA